MIVIVCLDDRNGMMFHNRRQSRDRILLEDLKAMCQGKKLWYHSYSEKILSDAGMKPGAEAVPDDEFLEDAGQGEFCFVENRKLLPYEEKIEKLIVYRWNRVYPNDFALDLDLCDPAKWKLEKSEEFQGYSHEKITKDYYMKVK